MTQPHELTHLYNPMTEREYNALPGLRWSVLSGMRKSPEQCAADRQRVWEPASGYRAIGSAVHELVLTPANATVAIFDGATRRGKAWDAFAAAHEGETICTADEWTAAKAIALKLARHPVAGPLLAEASYQEHALTWTEQTPHGDLACKARIDCLHSPAAPLPYYLLDLKTTRRDNPRDFARDAVDFGYVEQLGFYARGLAANGFALHGARLVVACTEEPYPCGVLDVDGRLLASADDRVQGLIRQYAECVALDRWPGWGDDGVLALGDYWPRWAELGNEDGVTLGGERA